jgi:hypothetical protein
MLEIDASCEIGDLINEVIAKTGKTWDEVETAFLKVGKFPESTKTFLTTQFGPIVKKDGFEWLNDALTEIMKEVNLTNLYVTYPI